MDLQESPVLLLTQLWPLLRACLLWPPPHSLPWSLSGTVPLLPVAHRYLPTVSLSWVRQGSSAHSIHMWHMARPSQSRGAREEALPTIHCPRTLLWLPAALLGRLEVPGTLTYWHWHLF